MVFRCFAPITGGRVSDIVAQESSLCGKKDNDSLPLNKQDDKFEDFCDKYGDFIDVNEAHEIFRFQWAKQKEMAGDTLTEKRRFPLILKALVSSFKGDMFKAFMAKMTWSILVIFSIWFFVFRILDYIKLRSKGEPTPGDENYPYYICAGFFACMYVLSVGIQQMGILSSILGSKVKAALTTSIYKKMIIRDAYKSKADVVALVAKDVEKIAEACLSLQYLWSGIFETVAVCAVTLLLLGIAILPGIALMAVFLPLQYCMGMAVAYRKKDLAVVSDKRISMMEEILRAIKLIKIYGWEDSFFKNLQNVREVESSMLNRINMIKATILGLIFALPPLLSLVIFGTQEATGTIEAVVVFTALSFFNTLRVPFSKLPKSLRDVLDAFSAMDRIQDFLLEPELHPELGSSSSLDDSTFEQEDAYNPGLIFKNASFSYGQGAKIILKDINLNVPAGSLMMVAGPVASGKSNLLKAILGDLTNRKGTETVSPSKAYVPQVPWTALGSVRDNILFGKPFNASFYRKVIHACALEPDLKMMPDGDKTWIGERGGNLSGGQKQRIALARAAYSGAKLYVLDSPLSAVDMYTCQHIFKYCIQDLMIASGGTVVLATHQTELFSKSDHLVVMQNGMTAYNDRYSFSGVKHLFPGFEDIEEEVGPADTKETTQKKKPQKKNSFAEHTGQFVPNPAKRALLISRSFAEFETKAQEVEDEEEEEMQRLEEAKAKKTAEAKKKEEAMAMVNHSHEIDNKSGIYTWYIVKFGVALFTISQLIFIFGQIVRVVGDNWVSVWTKRKYEPNGYTSDAFYAGIYVMLVIVFLCLSFTRAYYYYFTGKRAANKIHDEAFITALKAPMHFFHVTPIGKLLSFFSKDIDIIDDQLVDNMLMYFIMFWILILACGVVAYNLPLFLAIAGGLAVVYIYIIRVYIQTSVPLKKAFAEAHSQVVAHTAETLSGLAVVRAFRMQNRFTEDNLKYQAKSTVVTFSIANLTLWLAYRCDIVGSLLVLGCCLLAVLDSDMDASVAGLIVSNSFQILLFFSIMSRFMGDVHDNMNSAEQARKMCNLEEEMEPATPVEVPSDWPFEGEIQFRNVVMPYLPGKPPVLKGITFNIHPGQKIGVVGRTGAGKSSLIVALYRLAGITRGDILVDNVKCSSVKLHTLRSSMAIIPQEPVMFGGTLRSNLDPFNERSDEEILDALHKCLLGSVLEASEDGLYAKVENLGSNYSLGTQQLICLARAMLNPSKILLLDEATAALDSETNDKVSQVLKNYFADRTIFTIAHRLDTIIDSDRILVMNEGVVAEYDPPDVLLDNPQSIFYELCMNTGKAKFEALVAKANAHTIQC